MNKEYYEANKEQLYAGQERRKKELYDWIDGIKAQTPCADCGNKYHPYCMDFDHLPGQVKFKGISRLIHDRHSKASILEEIKKCELVCANCHRMRTFNRRNVKWTRGLDDSKGLNREEILVELDVEE